MKQKKCVNYSIEILEDRREKSAGRTPVSGEVEEHELLVLEDGLGIQRGASVLLPQRFALDHVHDDVAARGKKNQLPASGV